jgi:hypothetical protein
MTAPDAREQPATTTRATGTTFAVGQRVVANRDITERMLAPTLGNEMVRLHDRQNGRVVAVYSASHRFDYRVDFEHDWEWDVKAEWLDPVVAPPPVPSSREAVEHAVVERIISELEQEAELATAKSFDYWADDAHLDSDVKGHRISGQAQGVRRALQIVRKHIVPPSLDALVGTEPEHGLRLDTLHRPSGGDES